MGNTKIQQLIREAVDEATNVPTWPEIYRNKDTGKFYKPHHDKEAEFVYSDTPRFVLCKGSEGCIAADTLINNIPAAEFTGGNVSTLYGSAKASPTYPKGKADLYQVQTKSGRQVTVTLDHRFLTLTGWNQLRNLACGDLIALYGNDRVQLDLEKSINYQDDYLKDFHPYGELSTPQEVDVLDKLRQLANFLSYHSNLFSFDFSLLFRLYKKHYPYLLEQILLKTLMEYSFLPYVYEKHLYLSDIEKQPFQQISHLNITQSFHQEFQELSYARGVSDEKFQLSLDDNQPHHELNQQYYQFQRNQVLDYKDQQFFDVYRSFSSYNNFNQRYSPLQVWDEIVDIKFAKYGEYYDLNVPIVEHYEANGILHHNSGKSVAGIVKTLNRLKRGMNGIMVSPNLPHFNRSLWPEFRRWCPWELVVPEHRHRGRESWEAHKPFTLVIKNMYGTYSSLICGGIERPITFEGPNVHFAYVDEMRQIESPEVIKVLTGRIRLPGPKEEPPQLYITTTPRMHFMYDYFGPLQKRDDFAAFKKESKVYTLRIEDNIKAGNVDADYVKTRSSSLTEKERLVRVEAEWADEEDDTKFIENILLWDTLRQDFDFIKPKSQGGYADALVLGVDGSVSRDTFAIVGVTRHPDNIENVLVRLCKVWEPGSSGKIDFQGTPDNPGPELYIKTLTQNYNVVVIVYDEYQLHDMMSRFVKDGIAWCEAFSQVKGRTVADQQLYDLILQKRIYHTGQEELRSHIKNAGALIDVDSRKRRMIKMNQSKKIDAAVALSMAAYKCLYLNL